VRRLSREEYNRLYNLYMSKMDEYIELLKSNCPADWDRAHELFKEAMELWHILI
jgi:hypothetical protein